MTDCLNKITFFFGVLRFVNAIELTRGQLILLPSDRFSSKAGYSTRRN